MENPAKYREIEVHGGPRAMGREIGEAARDEIRAFCEATLNAVDLNPYCSTDEALDIARQSGRMAYDYRPEMFDEIEGTAEAAGVPLDHLLLLQCRNQLPTSDEGGCTSFSLLAEDGRIVAQNWDNDPMLDDFTVVLTRRPKGKPAVTTCTQAGLIAYIGFNELGLGACLNTLPAPSRRIGVPHYFTLRAIYEATSLDEALRAVQTAQRAIPANIMLSTPEGPADMEITVDRVHVLTGDRAGRLAHTNHCVHPDLAPINSQFPELIQSHDRKRRVDCRLAADRLPWDVEAVADVLRDHENYPRSICRHANDDPRHGAWETVFSVIIQPESRRMHVSRGTPCNRGYATYDMP